MKNTYSSNPLILATKKNKALGDLAAYIEHLENKVEEQANKLKSYNQEAEVQRWKHRHDLVVKQSLHVMTPTESEKAKNFSKKHFESCKENPLYELVGTGIGDVITVVCRTCKDREDITDLENW